MIWILKLFFIWLLIKIIKKSPNLSTAVVIACFFIYSNENIENINNTNTIEVVEKKEKRGNLYLKKTEKEKYKKEDSNNEIIKVIKESALSKKKKKSSNRIGAICRDGSRSNATGRGACSHHGGVAYWLYE